jgi:LAO/AO transport system kinase
MSKKELIKNRIKEKVSDQKISCHALRKLAEELGISYKEAGQAANDLKIKIKNCDLGCF